MDFKEGHKHNDALFMAQYPQWNFESLNVLVGGASQGIGAAAAKLFLQSGARVVLMARRREALEKVAQESGRPKNAYILAVDIGNREALSAEIEKLDKSLGGIQILVCNTAGPKAGSLLEASDEDFLTTFHHHLLVNSLLAKKLVPGMKQKKYGRIINIISTSVKSPIPNLGVSNTIRAAVAGWAKTLSFELAPYGITVNNVLPGYTKTPRLEALLKGTSDREKKNLKQVSDQWEESVPMKRFAEPEELAQAIAFLASPSAAYITGVSLPVDGGRTNVL